MLIYAFPQQLNDVCCDIISFQCLCSPGVDLWKLERRPNVGSMLVRLDFQSDVAPRLLFLKDLGLQDDQLGSVITTNPFILTESLDRLKARYKLNPFAQPDIRQCYMIDMTEVCVCGM